MDRDRLQYSVNCRQREQIFDSVSLKKYGAEVGYMDSRAFSAAQPSTDHSCWQNQGSNFRSYNFPTNFSGQGVIAACGAGTTHAQLTDGKVTQDFNDFRKLRNQRYSSSPSSCIPGPGPGSSQPATWPRSTIYCESLRTCQ